MRKYDELIEALDGYREAININLPNYDPVNSARMAKEKRIRKAEIKLDNAFVKIIESLKVT